MNPAESEPWPGPLTAVASASPHLPLVASELAFLRFIAGIRALLVALAGILLLADGHTSWDIDVMVLAPYMLWAALLLRLTIRHWQLAASKVWLWLDAGVLLLISHLVAGKLPLFGVLTVVPVVALAVLAGPRSAVSLALACAAGLLALMDVGHEPGRLGSWPVHVSLAVLVLGPASALLARPSRDLRLRLKVVDALAEHSDPRKGLHHQVTILLEQLRANFGLNMAIISLQGPEPRVFQLNDEGSCIALEQMDADAWRERFAALPRGTSCVCLPDAGADSSVLALEPAKGVSLGMLDDAGRHALRDIGPSSLVLPLTNYGQRLGTLCLKRTKPGFSRADLRWLHELMCEVMPLLERSDLLEQLQRESVSHERERIGRDLHDSAVQPYLGLKYGLEALSRQVRPDNPLCEPIRQLVSITAEELQTLRDVIGGLRRGDDPTLHAGAPLEVLHRQGRRFEALFGLKVNIVAPDVSRLRGSAAKAVLHMVNEALTNVRRHTAATTVTVLLDVTEHELIMRVRNDHGELKAPIADFLPRSLADRATEFGGGVRVRHDSDFTEVVVTLPLLGIIA